jgi:hypothetical protein
MTQERDTNLGGALRHGQVFLLICAALLAASGIAARGSDDIYTSFLIDHGGRLHLRLASGQYVLAPKDRRQVKFDTPTISKDGKTVGWLDFYPFPRAGKNDYDPGPIPQGLTIYRNRHILHQFGTNQIFYDWHFWRDATEVAYSVGPTHGGISEAFLCDVQSGKVLAHWLPDDANVPDWAKEFKEE